MVHNGIEYGMMQALAEGFSILKFFPFELDLAAPRISTITGALLSPVLLGG